jgi:peptide/nickel transport system permease protein
MASEAIALPQRRQVERGRLAAFLDRLRRARLGALGAAVIALLVLVAILAPLLAPYDPLKQNLLATLETPSVAHPLGTDDLGRDVLSRIILGARVSIQVGIVSVGLALTAGVLLGLPSGYFGGRLDSLIMRLMDALLSFPALVLALAITAVLGSSLTNAMIAIGIVYIPHFARLTRGSVLTVREREYITACRALGVPVPRILLRHILPNVLAPIIVQASLSVSYAIIAESSLAFLGLGVQPPTPTWGSMLRIGYNYLETAPWLSLFPGAAIFVTVLAFNFLGDGLRDALDPRLRRRGDIGQL